MGFAPGMAEMSDVTLPGLGVRHRTAPGRAEMSDVTHPGLIKLSERVQYRDVWES